MENAKTPNKKRKRKYTPNLAAASFKPRDDWSSEEARNQYLESKFPFEVDHIIYDDSIVGMKNLQESSIDVIVADPPFGLNFSGKESIYNRNPGLVRDGYREVGEKYEEFSIKWISELPRIMKKTSSAWIFSGWTNLIDILNAIKKTGLILINDIIWKYQFGVFTERKFVTSHYHILFCVKSPDYYFNKIMHYPLDVWEINRDYRPRESKNGTKLPENVVSRCIDFTSKPGDLILDPFIGNGTTAIVAKANYRHYLGFEINQNMEEIIKSNLNYTKIGESYYPYKDRYDEHVEKARRKFQKKNLVKEEK
jgi:site-specific DNA-methyltransferase (adenine-specific)